MSNWFGEWFGYGLGAAAGKAIFGDDAGESGRAREPIRAWTEEEIRAGDEALAAEEKRAEAEAAGAKVLKHRGNRR